MGTRADFYIGQGVSAEWLGSIAWDGYPEGMVQDLFACCTEEEWRQHIKEFLASRKDATHPNRGWPWPWDDSSLTDYSYAFLTGRCGLVVLALPRGGWPRHGQTVRRILMGCTSSFRICVHAKMCVLTRDRE